MKNIVIVSAMNQLSITYDGDWFYGKEKGIKQMQTERNPHELKGTIREFALGKNVRNKIRIGCACRCWTNPYIRYDAETKIAEEQRKASIDHAQRQAMLQQQKESVMEDFKTFLHNPTREGWEKMKFKKKLKKIKLEAEAQIRQHPVSGKDQKVWRIVMIYEDEIITSADIPVEQ